MLPHAYLNGDDINSDPHQKPSRYVINFWDWPSEKAKEYTLPWKWIEENAKAERLQKNDRGAREKWWLFHRARSELYHLIGRANLFEQHPADWKEDSINMPQVIATSRHTKFFNPSFVNNDSIFSDATVVFGSQDYALYTFLNSALVDTWVQKFASTMGQTIRFTPSDCFETLPMPKFSENLIQLGKELSHLRKSINVNRQIGTSAIYNLFHSKDENGSDITALRDLHQKIDIAVSLDYGWKELDLRYDFYIIDHLPLSDQIRFTISEKSRIGLLKRLADLNLRRFSEEKLDNLPRASKSKKVKSKKSFEDTPLQSPLDFGG